jgi:hypothetical protein
MSGGGVVPMLSARIGNGRYEVVGTSNAVECFRERSYWWLMIDGDRETSIGPFETKRAALQFAQESPEL